METGIRIQSGVTAEQQDKAVASLMAIMAQGRESGMDQETIRFAMGVFQSVTASAPVHVNGCNVGDKIAK